MGGVYQQFQQDPAKAAKRYGLGVLTSGTSEIQTGGGVNKDETVADSLFPKAVNDLMLEDREKARAKSAADQKAQDEALTGPKPPPAPDLTDEAIRESRRRQMRQTAMSRGRRSTFLTGPLGAPAGVPKKSLLGGGY